MVRLPADTCPVCQANMRTGLRPADAEKTSFWHRRWGRLAVILLLLIGPPSVYLIGYGDLGDLMKGGMAKFGLEHCAEPRNRWDDFNQDDFENYVRSGYTNWKDDKPTRRVGENPNGPESPLMAARSREQKLQYQDTRTYFASSLMSDGPSKTLKPDDNWYLRLNGEWEVAFIQGEGTPNERIIAGEWNYAWINNGEALQDVLTLPFRWLKPPAGVPPILITTIRHFNPIRNAWEGFHIQSGQMFYFGAVRNNAKIVETYKIENGPIMVWVFDNMLNDSFQVTISQSVDNGSTYQTVGSLWAKKRSFASKE
jgi:hypothetical protein